MIHPQFVDNELFFLLDTSRSEKEQLLALSKNLKNIQTLKTTDFSSFEDLINSYLKVGLGIFNMKIGIVSQIDGDAYTVCNCVSEIDQIDNGTVFPVEGTYCKEVVKTNSVIGLPHVGTLEEMKDHPVYENMKLESYISAPILVDNKLFGTLNFSSTSPRQFGFSEHEKDLIIIMSNSIASFIKFEKKENALKKINERMKRLVGYVAHDLRSPLSNISKMTAFIKSEEYSDIARMIRSASDKALEFVHTILETAALGSGKIKLDLITQDISALLLERYEHHRALKNDKNLIWELDISPGLKAKFDKSRITQVLDNLLSNCGKYTNPEGKISVSLSTLGPQGIVLRITNAIHSQHSDRIFDIENSIGFGLDIVNEILMLHDSELEIIVSPGLYKSQFKLNLQ